MAYDGVTDLENIWEKGGVETKGLGVGSGDTGSGMGMKRGAKKEGRLGEEARHKVGEKDR